MDIVPGYTFDDVLLVPKYTEVMSRDDVDLSVNLGKGIKLNIPIVSANMKNVTGVEMAKKIGEMGGLALLHRFCTIDEQTDMWKESEFPNNVGCSIGVQKEDIENAKKIFDVGCKIICIDVAHAHSKICLSMVENIAKEIQARNSNVLLIVGNIATYKGALSLYDAGADVIKAGIGGGSLCLTRLEAGTGVPQLTALENCYKIKSLGRKIAIIADGGLRRAGDCVKALIFSDAVMLGNILAGTNEAPGNITVINKTRYKEYEGSSTYNNKHVEGVKGLIPLKGEVTKVVQTLLEGIKSGLSYQGAHNLERLKENPQFVSISSAGLIESNHHDILIN